MKLMYRCFISLAVLALFGCSTVSTIAPQTAPPQARGPEGILIVDQAMLPNTTVYAGQTNVPVMSLRFTAKLSDLKAQRVQIDLGTNKVVYTKVFRTLYLADSTGRIIAFADLNDNTVVKAGTNYLVTLAGFDALVPKDQTEIFTIRADLYPTIRDIDLVARTFAIPANGFRAIDKAGIDQYGPTTMIAQTVVVAPSIADSARIVISQALDNFPMTEVVAAAGPNNDSYDKLPLLKVRLYGDKDYLHVAQFRTTIGKTEGSAVATTAYLYDGTRLIGSASINSKSGAALFNGLDIGLAPGSARDLTVKADIHAASRAPTSFFAMVASDGIVAENSQGSKVETVGAVMGNQLAVRNVGPVFELVEAPTEKNQHQPAAVNATFWLKIRAVGGDIYFGAKSMNTFTFDVYRNGVPVRDALIRSIQSTVLPSKSFAVTTGLRKAEFMVPQNREVVIPVLFTFIGRGSSGGPITPGLYTVGLKQITWSVSDGDFADAHWQLDSSNFMAGQSAWMSSVVSLP